MKKTITQSEENNILLDDCGSIYHKYSGESLPSLKINMNGADVFIELETSALTSAECRENMDYLIDRITKMRE